KKPTRIYVIMASNDPLYFRMIALMDNCKAATDKLEVDYLSPDRDRERVVSLGKDFQFDERQGILILYGEGGERDSRFVKYQDLFDVDQMRNQRFKGEQAIMTELSLLEEGKSRPTIYFTQGNGEFDINDMRNSDDGLGIVRSEFERAHFQVKGL